LDSAAQAPVPLASIAAGHRVRLVGVHTHACLETRLAAMGLLPGTVITIVANHFRGPMIVAVMGSRVMLGRGMAQKALVRPAQPHPLRDSDAKGS